MLAFQENVLYFILLAEYMKCTSTSHAEQFLLSEV